jgi:hypothetical protein
MGTIFGGTLGNVAGADDYVNAGLTQHGAAARVRADQNPLPSQGGAWDAME